MKRAIYSTIFFILIFSQIACVQAQQVNPDSKSQAKTEPSKFDYPSLKIQANEVGKATIDGDFNKVIDYTYPKVVEMVGGKEKMLTFLRKDSEQNKADGVAYISVEIGEPIQVEKVENQIFGVLPMKMVLKNQDGKFMGESALVGISDDDGKNWKFISSVNQKRFNAMFPKAAGKIKMPEDKLPTPIN